MAACSDAACCGDVDYLRVYSDSSKSRTTEYEHEDDLFMRRPVSVPSEFRSRTKRDPETQNRMTHGCCPLKPGFRCGAVNFGTSESAIARVTQGVCFKEMCPYIRKRITDNPRDVLGARSECDPDEFSLEAIQRRRRLAQQDEEDSGCRIPWNF